MGTKNPKTSVVMSALLLGAVCIARGRIITVDDDAPADFNNIQAAIDDANDWDIVEVRPGIYRGSGNRDIDFNGKAITVRSTDPNDPSVVATTVIDCNGTWDDQHRGFYFHSGEDANSVLDGLTVKHGYTYYSGGGILGENNASPTIRNCVITRNEAAYDSGGGVCGCNGVITKCTIVANYASTWGGGLYNCNGIIRNCVITGNHGHYSGGGLNACAASITDCTITGNEASYEGGLRGCDGAITNCTISDNWGGQGGSGGVGYCDGPITNCIITGNSSSLGVGGGLRYCNGPITNCIISNNSTIGGPGGGLFNCNGVIANCVIRGNDGDAGGGLSSCSGVIANCTIVANYSYGPGGGGLYGCDGVITNCTIVGNYAHWDGGGLNACHGPITNCIIWRNIAQVSGGQIYSCSDPNYSCIQDWGDGGIGNIVDDPCFADLGYWHDNNTPDYPSDDFWVEGDCHLKSQAGRWNPNTQSWVQDDVTSPCIDAGDPNSPIGPEPFPNGGRINMGTYGGTVEASRSYCGDRFSDEAVAADINGDCKVDFKDVAILAFHWLKDNNP